MALLDNVKGVDALVYNKLTVILGKPGSGKTTLAGTYPKPMLYVSINSDGGGVVLKDYGKGIDTLDITSKPAYHQIMNLIKELDASHKYKSIVFDAYSSIEEDLVTTMGVAKGKRLSLDERGVIGGMMSRMRDALVNLAERGDVEFVLVSHVKNADEVDNISGEKTVKIIPKMTHNNGNTLNEKASNVMYCVRKPVRSDDGKVEVKFLTYIGAHPYIDTKLRRNGAGLKSLGLYIENCTYVDIKELLDGKPMEEVVTPNVIDTPIDKNPFDEVNEKEEW